MKAASPIIAQRSKIPLLLELDLTQGLLEAPPATPIQGLRARHTPVLRSVVEALCKATTDDKVAGLVAHLGARQPTLAQSGELRGAVDTLRRAGKPTVCWAETFGEVGPGNVSYHLASAFEDIWLQPSGDVGLTGVVAEAVFVRDALDKLGVLTQIGQRHEYKTAANTFLESSMTGPHREMAERLASSAMSTIVADLAASRGLSAEAVHDAVDHAPLTAEEALQRRLVDRLGYRDEVYADLRQRLGDVQLRYVSRYGKGPAGLGAAPARLGARNKPTVAVVQASGGIRLGRSAGRSPLASPSVGSDSLNAALRAAAADDTVAAVVLRVDSPGGSYVASDAIRREVISLRENGKPVIASMASIAGSGGYYIAMPADAIVANAGTLTGSIGVLAGKQVIKDALSRVGVQRESVAIGAYAEMFSSQRPFSDDEWQRLAGWLDRVYADFTNKAAADRQLPLAELQSVAKGRVWTGADARDIGLVDEIGGLDRAIDLAANRAGRKRSEVDVRPFPKLNVLERVRPAENSEHSAAAAARSDPSASLLSVVYDALGLPPLGVLSMPVTWRLG